MMFGLGFSDLPDLDSDSDSEDSDSDDSSDSSDSETDSVHKGKFVSIGILCLLCGVLWVVMCVFCLVRVVFHCRVLVRANCMLCVTLNMVALKNWSVALFVDNALNSHDLLILQIQHSPKCVQLLSIHTNTICPTLTKLRRRALERRWVPVSLIR